MTNQKIGILGGGQLGKMLIQAGLDFDLNISILENDENCPCGSISKKFVVGDINNFDDVYNFGKNMDIITIEIENVNIEALEKLQSEGIKVFPQPEVLKIIKNKVWQKQFFEKNEIPTAAFQVVNSIAEIDALQLKFPIINKIAVGGYDGKGVKILKSKSDVSKAFDCEGILEDFVDFEKELAVIVARNENGEISTFPVVEMVFHPEANLVEYLFSPANISEKIENEARNLAIKTAESFNIVGLLAVEMFLTKQNTILVNEVAPRPHNSGHQSQKANFTSQFDQHLRALLNLPFGNTEAILPAAMVNILGEENYSGETVYKGLDIILKEKNIFPFFYNKKTTKAFRKMGHVTILESNFEKLKEKVNFVKENLKVISK